ncbi:MAG: hypothetical protein NC417_06050 [Candidatus Gastranaerophilales bacterium]|nr:hypothetical protein [Candidatus Gastranaerophilales bacterium]
MIIGFIFWSIIAALFLGIGISGLKSKEAVGFFTFVKAPIVNDVKKYNHTVSMLWFAGAVLLEMMGIPLLFFEQNSPIFLLVVLGVIALVIGMMVGYMIVEKKYSKV